MDKHELKIEAEEHFLEHGALNKTQLEPNNVHIKIYAGDTLVAETNLESLVMKFLIVSGEHAQAMVVLGMIEKNHVADGKIVLQGPKVPANGVE